MAEPSDELEVPRISIVIPTLNEIEALPATLERLFANQTLFECVICDGGSTDGTLAYLSSISDSRLTVVHSAPGRGLQLNVGARAAKGSVLLFNHADTQLPQDWCEQLLAAKARTTNGDFWGGFKHKFSAANWKLDIISWLHNWRWRCTGVIYGDQSMFVQRAFFLQLGGFAESGLEDLEFSDRALGHAQSVFISSPVITDSRKFKELGEFRGLAHVVSIILRYERARELGNEVFFKPYR